MPEGPFGFPRLTSIGPFVEDDVDVNDEDVIVAVKLSNMAIAGDSSLSGRSPKVMLATSYHLMNPREKQGDVADRFDVSTVAMSNTYPKILRAIGINVPERKIKSVKGGGVSKPHYSMLDELREKVEEKDA